MESAEQGQRVAKVNINMKIQFETFLLKKITERGGYL